ncbi:N-6 DNA methylase [Streptomyces tagetis]|uniref:N-6 DNA methylase n=1 Tax=Streptomyces tagetis TaxID=2820809 RepID=A0A941B3Y6_9ACTN|nr:N-6 DNA methylase [Streptomyces sp. RG38]MBQ0830815.1 N-6 DNA methylase [Streptomyces sp. RG38]
MTDFDVRSRGGDANPEFAGVLVSRPDIARLAGVKRPAVTNWERRYADYPAPLPRSEGARGAAPEMFRADEVLAWLSARPIPANALLPGEPSGTTYGDRFRAGLTGSRAGGLLAAVKELTGPAAERMRGPVPLPLYLDWLLYLVFRAIVEADGGQEGSQGRTQAGRDVAVPEEKYPRGLPADLQNLLDRNPPSSPEDGRQAFDLVLTLLRDAEDRGFGDFLTPPSVSRVMAGALAAVAPAVPTPYDPFCRTGELLAAYLDATAERDGPGPRRVRGRVLHDRALRIARMNVRVHGADDAELALGPGAPPPDPDGMFDVILTNPPFGGRTRDDGPPPAYWTYGPARRVEFDWLQYVISRLAPEGRAAVLMPAAAAFHTGAARTVRAGLVEAGIVECVMALPGQLFGQTAIKTHIWFLRATPGPVRDVLFVDGEDLGHVVSRTRQTLFDDDVARLVREYGSWCSAADSEREYPGTPGLSRAVAPGEIVAHDHRLDPATYVRTAMPEPAVTDSAEVRGRLAGLAQEIEVLQARARNADADALRQLRRYGL